MGFQSRLARWMNMYVDTNDMHANSPGKAGISPGKDLFRRRIVFELDADQLPLLEAAQERHGSKRSALIAALLAEAGAVDLAARAEAAEAALAKAKGAAKGSSAAKEKAAKKLERDLRGDPQAAGFARKGAGQARHRGQGDLSRAARRAGARRGRSRGTRSRERRAQGASGRPDLLQPLPRLGSTGWVALETGERRLPCLSRCLRRARAWRSERHELARPAQALRQSEPPKRSGERRDACLRSRRWRDGSQGGSGSGARSPARGAVSFASGPSASLRSGGMGATAKRPAARSLTGAAKGRR